MGYTCQTTSVGTRALTGDLLFHFAFTAETKTTAFRCQRSSHGEASVNRGGRHSRRRRQPALAENVRTHTSIPSNGFPNDDGWLKVSRMHPLILHGSLRSATDEMHSIKKRTTRKPTKDANILPSPLCLLVAASRLCASHLLFHRLVTTASSSHFRHAIEPPFAGPRCELFAVCTQLLRKDGCNAAGVFFSPCGLVPWP